MFPSDHQKRETLLSDCLPVVPKCFLLPTKNRKQLEDVGLLPNVSLRLPRERNTAGRLSACCQIFSSDHEKRKAFSGDCLPVYFAVCFEGLMMLTVFI
jgi:hypothetical protein